MSNEPRAYNLQDPEEIKRFGREVADYLHVCRRCGGDEAGRRYAKEAARAIADGALMPGRSVDEAVQHGLREYEQMNKPQCRVCTFYKHGKTCTKDGEQMPPNGLCGEYKDIEAEVVEVARRMYSTFGHWPRGVQTDNHGYIYITVEDGVPRCAGT